MLCSRCSHNVLPVVAIDIDGTLADYHGHFQEFSQLWTGINLPEDWSYTGDVPYGRWWMETFKPHDLTSFRACKLAYRQGGMKRTQPVVLGAAQLVNILGEVCEVWLTTTRPHDRFDRVDPDTREWLRRNDIKFDGLLYSGNKMKELADRVSSRRVVAVLDDQYDILEDARARGLGQPIKAGSSYNSAWGWDPSADGLIEAYNMINILVEDWNRRNG